MPRPASKPKPPKPFFWVLNALLAVAFAADVWLGKSYPFLDGLLFLLAAITSIVALAQQLPLQNALPVALIIAVIGSLAHGLSALPTISLPFGPMVFDPAAGYQIFGFVPWIIPFIWIIAVLNARGVARLALRPWRKVKNYGYWLIGATAVLTMVFDLALEPYAGCVNLWFWQPTKLAITWHGATPLNFLGWLFVTLLMMMFVTPMLIRKQPGKSGGPDFQPLFIWLGALILFGVAFVRGGMWWPLGVDAVIAAVTTAFAVRGAKW